MTAADDVAAFVELMWAKHRDRVLSRLGLLQEALDALARGDAADREAAATQAHALAGGLGTYGRPGSELMQQAEQALRGPDEADWLALAGAVRELTRGL